MNTQKHPHQNVNEYEALQFCKQLGDRILRKAIELGGSWLDNQDVKEFEELIENPPQNLFPKNDAEGFYLTSLCAIISKVFYSIHGEDPDIFEGPDPNRITEEELESLEIIPEEEQDPLAAFRENAFGEFHDPEDDFDLDLLPGEMADEMTEPLEDLRFLEGALPHLQNLEGILIRAEFLYQAATDTECKLDWDLTPPLRNIMQSLKEDAEYYLK